MLRLVNFIFAAAVLSSMGFLAEAYLGNVRVNGTYYGAAGLPCADAKFTYAALDTACIGCAITTDSSNAHDLKIDVICDTNEMVATCCAGQLKQ
jgi:hypothetical protein